MRNVLKLLMLVVSLIPMFYFVFFILTFFSDSFLASSFIFSVHFLAMGLVALLLLVSVVHLFKNPTITGPSRTQWLILLMMGNIIALPIYWFVNLRKP